MAPWALSGSQVKDKKEASRQWAGSSGQTVLVRKQLTDRPQSPVPHCPKTVHSTVTVHARSLPTPHPKAGSGTKERVTKERVSVRVETLERLNDF